MNSSEHLATVDLVKREIKSAQYHTAVHINMALIKIKTRNVSLAVFKPESCQLLQAESGTVFKRDM